MYYQGKEYRLATYLGVKIVECSEHRVVLKQRQYRLEIDIDEHQGHSLKAPQQGKMSRTIHENAACGAQIKFYEKDQLLFDYRSEHCSFEYTPEQQ